MRTILAKLWRVLHLPVDLQLRIMRVVNDELMYRQVAWSLPGGYLKAKEHPTEGLEREIKEETGLIVSVDEPLRIRTDRTTGRLDLCYIGTFI